MTKSGLLLAAALAFTVTAAPAKENPFESANNVLPGCRDLVDNKMKSDMAQGFCAGMVRGMATFGSRIALMLKLAVLPSKKEIDSHPDELAVSRRRLANALQNYWCMDIPNKVTLVQEVRVVIAYIEARPARMHEDFDSLTHEALQAAWPCK
jgi:Rap1a immunity proteins